LLSIFDLAACPTYKIIRNQIQFSSKSLDYIISAFGISFASMKKGVNSAYLLMHVSVMLWGFTAILGKLIELREYMLVWYRMWITALLLLLLPGTIKWIRNIKLQNIAPLTGIGMLVALHWVCFYGSVKFSNASIAATCIGITSFFTAIIEPILLRKPFQKTDILLGLSIIPGIWLISEASPAGYGTGIVLGIISSLLAASFSVLNKVYADQFDAAGMTWVEMISGALLLTLLLPVYFLYFPDAVAIPTTNDWLLLLAMSVFCTIIPFMISIYALRYISAFTSVFMLNLEPLYSIVLAILILNENQELGLQFYVGAGLILLAVTGHGAWTQFQKRKEVLQNP
jgi:drug/metabolite transporter (DMT)-like permease